MMNNDCYKLVGTINLFGVCPEFVYPIFERNGKYYFQCSNNATISSFKEIVENLYEKMIRFFDANDVIYMNIKKDYTIGDEIVIAFQINRNKLLVSDVDSFVPFIKDFDTDDHILTEEIDEFLSKVNFRNTIIKKREKFN